MEQLFIKNYKITNLIGEGNFGKVYKAIHPESSVSVAIKLEKSSKYSQIENEIQVLKTLHDNRGFPKLIDFGTTLDQKFYIMTLLEQNLYSYILHNRTELDPSSILELALECLILIQTLHSKSFIHRDIKPNQFLFDKYLNMNLVDFGLCKKYIHGNIIHIPYNENRPFVGTQSYASLYTHLGIQQSRRDDLESFCYMVSFMINGKLPWSKNKARKLEASEIKKMKNNTNGLELFGCNSELDRMFKYVKQLGFEETPNYDLIGRCIKECLEKFKVGFVERVKIREKSEKARKRRKGKKKEEIKIRILYKTQNDLSAFDGESLTMNEINYKNSKGRKKSEIFQSKTLFKTQNDLSALEEKSLILIEKGEKLEKKKDGNKRTTKFKGNALYKTHHDLSAIEKEGLVMNEKSEELLENNKVKKSGNYKRSNICKTLNELLDNEEESLLTEICETLPEIRNRSIVRETSRILADNKEILEKYNCLIS